MKKIIFYNFVIVISLILFLEICVRIFSSISEQGFDRSLYNFNTDTLTHNKNTKSDVMAKKVFTDNYGFRVPKKNYTYKDNETSTLIMGDSVSFGVGALEEDTFIGLLRREFNNINFYNSSVAGHTIESYKNLLKIYEEDLEFDSIIIFYCLNDIISDSGVVQRKDITQNSFLKEINIFLRNKSFLFIYFKSVVTITQKRYFDYISPIYKDQASLKNLKNQILSINNFSILKNKKLHFVVLPYEFQTRDRNCNDKYLFPQNELAKIFNNNQIMFYDFSKNFCDHPESEKLFLKFDAMHLSDIGHHFVSDLIQDAQLIK